MTEAIRIGSRASQLALIQTESVAAEIKKLYPHLELKIVPHTTEGDRDQKTPLNRMESSVFVKELEEALLKHEIDIAVHSLKDLPTEVPEALCILAIPERLDPRDVLISQKGRLDNLPSGSKIGTGSLRRAVQLTHYRSDLEICPIRGNVDTRLSKIPSGEVDGIITAAAAMIRLQCEDKITEYLPTEYFLPAAGQGALAVEARREDKNITQFLSSINDIDIWQCAMAERSFLNAIGTGCHSPSAALATMRNNALILEAMIADIEGKHILRSWVEGDPSRSEDLGIKLAKKIIELGASEFIDSGTSK